jgi:two-component system response regulator YesN
VLVVEDEIWMIEGVKAIFKKYATGFTITGIARDGNEAMLLLKEESFDVMIMDIAMPNMDGLTLLGVMQRHDIKIPVVIITGHSEFQYARIALRHGVVDYLLKPLDRQELLDVMQNLAKQMETANQDDSAQNPSDKLDHFKQGSLLVEKMIELIQARYMEDISLSGFADQAGFNSSYLSRLFKLQTGKGFVQYLTEIRMEQARKLLRMGQLNIADISRQVGFWDEKHFSRTFKKTEGMSPVEYRKSDLT